MAGEEGREGGREGGGGGGGGGRGGGGGGANGSQKRTLLQEWSIFCVLTYIAHDNVCVCVCVFVCVYIHACMRGV